MSHALKRESKRPWSVQVHGVEVVGVWRPPYWHVRFTLRGRRYKKTTRCEYRMPAQAEAGRIVSAMTAPRSATITIAELFDAWLAWQLLHFRKRSNTANADRSRARCIVAHLDEMGVTLLADLTAVQVEAMRTSLIEQKRAPKTVNNYLMTVGAAVRWAVGQGMLESNPLAGVQLIPKRSLQRRFVRVYSKAEFDAIIHAATDLPSPFMEAVLLAAYSGLRRSEICALNVRDIERNGEQLALRIERGKSASPRVVPLHRSLVPIISGLARERASDAPLFIMGEGRACGQRMHPQMLGRAVSDIVHQLGITDVRHPLHTLRHTFASRLLLELRQPEAVVMQLMGHRDSATLRQYTHVQRSDTEAAIAAL